MVFGVECLVDDKLSCKEQFCDNSAQELHIASKISSIAPLIVRHRPVDTRSHDADIDALDAPERNAKRRPDRRIKNCGSNITARYALRNKTRDLSV